MADQDRGYSSSSLVDGRLADLLRFASAQVVPRQGETTERRILNVVGLDMIGIRLVEI